VCYSPMNSVKECVSERERERERYIYIYIYMNENEINHQLLIKILNNVGFSL